MGYQADSNSNSFEVRDGQIDRSDRQAGRQAAGIPDRQHQQQLLR